MVEPGPSARAGDAEDLPPFEDVDVAAAAGTGPAPSGHSLSEPERSDIERQLRPGEAEAAG